MNTKDLWGTPQDFFDKLNGQFNFTLDPCANSNRLLKPKEKMVSLTEEQNGLKGDWTGHVVFVNPPYSRNQLETWLKKCYDQRHIAKDIVTIIPANRTGAGYFHAYVLGSAEIGFIQSRLKFIPLAGQKVGSNPMNTIIAVWQSAQSENIYELPGTLQDFENRW